MPVESATTIPGLNDSWPLGADPKSEGDNHLRLIKRVLQDDALSLSAPTAVTANGFGVEAGTPAIFWQRTGADPDEGRFQLRMEDGQFVLEPIDDLGSALPGALKLLRDATGMTDVQINRPGDETTLPTADSVPTKRSGDTRWVQIADAEGADGYVAKTGDTMTGGLTVEVGGVTSGTSSASQAKYFTALASNGVIAGYRINDGGDERDVLTRTASNNLSLGSANWTGDQLLNGDWLCDEPTADDQVANKVYVDERTSINRSGQMLSGTWDTSGTAEGAANGYSVTRSGTGTYVVTYDVARTLGNHAITCTAFDGPNNGNRVACVSARGINGFTVRLRSISSGDLVDCECMFMVM